jgi:hypothetical protein
MDNNFLTVLDDAITKACAVVYQQNREWPTDGRALAGLITPQVHEELNRQGYTTEVFKNLAPTRAVSAGAGATGDIT